jgi:hypothetical protein
VRPCIFTGVTHTHPQALRSELESRDRELSEAGDKLEDSNQQVELKEGGEG